MIGWVLLLVVLVVATACVMCCCFAGYGGLSVRFNSVVDCVLVDLIYVNFGCYIAFGFVFLWGC